MAITEHCIRRTGAGAEIEQSSGRKMDQNTFPPPLMLAERQDAVDPVVLTGNVGEDRPVAQDQPIVSKPT